MYCLSAHFGDMKYAWVGYINQDDWLCGYTVWASTFLIIVIHAVNCWSSLIRNSLFRECTASYQQENFQPECLIVMNRFSQTHPWPSIPRFSLFVMPLEAKIFEHNFCSALLGHQYSVHLSNLEMFSKYLCQAASSVTTSSACRSLCQKSIDKEYGCIHGGLDCLQFYCRCQFWSQPQIWWQEWPEVFIQYIFWPWLAVFFSLYISYFSNFTLAFGFVKWYRWSFCSHSICNW